VSDTEGNTFVIGPSQYSGSATAGEDYKTQIFYCLLTSANASNVVTSVLDTARTWREQQLVWFSLSGVHATSGVQIGSTTGSGNSATDVTAFDASPAMSAVTGDLAVGLFCSTSAAFASGWTPDSGYTTRGSASWSRFIANEISSDSTYAPGGDVVTGDPYGAVSAVFEEAASAGNPIIVPPTGPYYPPR
jgi:hypothetical protein